MNWVKHEKNFSIDRLVSYLIACNQDVDKAMQLYRYNIQVSQALYPLLSILEVSLRNGIDRALTNYFRDARWLITQRMQFASHPMMIYKDPAGIVYPDLYFENKLQKAENWLKARKKAVTHGNLLPELTFGFWLKFFDVNSIKVLKGASIEAFTNRPARNISSIHAQLKSIHQLRNRIAHNEPICFNASGNICLDTIAGYEYKILEALSWLDTELKIWSDKMNYFQLIFKRISALV